MADPVAPMAQWLDAQLEGQPLPRLLIVVGLARGGVLDALERRHPSMRVLALEPDASAARAFLTLPIARRWLEAGQLTCLVGPDYAGSDTAWKLLPEGAKELKLLLHPTLQKDVPDTVSALRAVKSIVYGARANADARRLFAPRYLTNSLRNAPAIAAGLDVRALAGAYAGFPGIIAAAGPSLDRAIDPLRRLAGHGLLIAVDTALRPLLNAGLAPHLGVGLDPSEANGRHFRELPESPHTWMVSESALDPAAHRHFGDRTFWFRVADHEPWPWYRELGLDVGILEVWGSVLTAAFQVALLAGCDPIVFVGADLAYTSEQPYCRGTTYEFDWAKSTAGGSDLRDQWKAWTSAANAVRVADVTGGETTSTPPLLAFRDWLVTQAARSGRRVINASGSGTLFGNGVTQMPLADALTARPNVPSIADVVRGARRQVHASELAVRLREVSAALANGAETPVVARWKTFSGTGWDAAVVRATLDEAASVLERSAAPAVAVAPPMPATSVLRHLPEAAAHWRAIVVGLDAPDKLAGPPWERETFDALLADAAAVLHRIHTTLRQNSVDLAAPPKPEDFGTQVLSLACEWPGTMAWDTVLFEGLLGAVSQFGATKLGPVVESYFSRGVVLREPIVRSTASGTSEGSHPHATLACALLALEWAMCAWRVSGSADSADGAPPYLRWLRAVARSMRTPGDSVARSHASIVLETDHGESGGALTIPVALDTRGLARIGTGIVCDGTAEALESSLTQAASDVLALQAGPAWFGLHVEGRVKGNARSRSPFVRITPRVLTDEGVARASVAYSEGEGAVCVTPYSEQSVIVGADGSVRPHQTWPRAIVGQLPFGERGTIAWGTGVSAWPHTVEGPAYAMYRRSDGDETIVEELAVRPLFGAWWQGRLYWNCYPTPAASWVGLSSWAPGEEVRLDIPGMLLYGIHPLDDGLALHPCIFTPGTGYERRRLKQGWTWSGSRALKPLELGINGAVSAQAFGHGWTAEAYPEADAIRILSVDGRAALMTCYRPFGVAWAGESLLVSTIERELLLFEHVRSAVESVAVSTEARPCA